MQVNFPTFVWDSWVTLRLLGRFVVLLLLMRPLLEDYVMNL